MSVVSQGTTVSFNGASIGSLIGVSGSGGSAVMADVTSFDSTVVGSGTGSRIRKQADCLGIDPGSATITLLGMPPYSPTSIGTKGTLSVSTPGGSLSGEACLQSYEVEASVGELLRGTATFAFTGS